MTHRITPLLLLTLAVSPAAAQSRAAGYVDPRPVLEAAAKTMGVDKVRCISFAGTGYAGRVGQNVTQDTDWPRGEPLANYTRTINYDARTSIERFTRKPGQNPRSWKYGTGWLGGTPFQKHERQTFAVNGSHGWHMDGDGAPIPAPADAELWQLDNWLNPIGFIKAAKAPGANPVAVWRWEMAESGRDGATTAGIEKITLVSITVLGKYRVNATIDSKNLIPRIQTWVPHPVLGDMNYEHEYTDWRDIDGVKFPAGWHHHDGWDDERQIPTISGGHNGFGGSFPQIEVNACGDSVTAPDTVRNAALVPARVVSQKLADGVWLLGGASHNSVAVEFKNFVTVIEAPLDEQRSLAVIEEIVRLVPNKPIRFIVNTHNHYDHLGGLRAYLHIGATVITHQRNRVFYETELLNYVPRILRPDMVSLFPPTEISEGYTLEDVDEKYIVSDGSRNLDLYYVQGLSHVEGMLMAYLPKEKILIEADLYDTHEPPVDAPTAVHRAFRNNAGQLGLDISTIVPIHGQPVPWTDFLKMFGGK